VIYPCRPNAGITPPHRHWWWSQCSRLQGRVELDVMTPGRQHQRNDSVLQVQHLVVSYTFDERWLLPESMDLAEIAEVDRFWSNPEFPQDDIVLQWIWPRSYAALWGATWEGDAWEREWGGAWGGEERSSKGIPSINLCQTLLQGVSLYRREEGSLPSHQGI
jgi:hypothetical protein